MQFAGVDEEGFTRLQRIILHANAENGAAPGNHEKLELIMPVQLHQRFTGLAGEWINADGIQRIAMDAIFFQDGAVRISPLLSGDNFETGKSIVKIRLFSLKSKIVIVFSKIIKDFMVNYQYYYNIKARRETSEIF